MTDTAAPSTAAAPVETTAPVVTQPSTQSKPYDDDMLEVYENQATEESAPEESSSKGESLKQDTENKEENTTQQGKPDEKEDTSEESKLDNPKATKDDKVIDGVEELPVKRLINGKEVEFKIKDAIQSYVKQEEFNRNMDRRLTEVSKKEKAWQREQETFKDKVMEVVSKAQNGNFVDGIRALAKLAAGDSEFDVVKFEKDYFDQLESVRKVYTEMTPEQREAYFAKRQAAEAKAKADRLEAEKATTQAQAQLQSRIDSLVVQNNLKHEEFWGAYKHLIDTSVGQDKVFKDANEITEDVVLNHALSVKHWEKVYTAADKLGVQDDRVLEEVARITSSDPTITAEDIETVLKNAGIAKPDVVENLNRKVGKSQSNSTASSTKKANGKVEGIDADDLDFLYRNQPKTYQRIHR